MVLNIYHIMLLFIAQSTCCQSIVLMLMFCLFFKSLCLIEFTGSWNHSCFLLLFTLLFVGLFWAYFAVELFEAAELFAFWFCLLFENFLFSSWLLFCFVFCGILLLWLFVFCVCCWLLLFSAFVCLAAGIGACWLILGDWFLVCCWLGCWLKCCCCGCLLVYWGSDSSLNKYSDFNNI